MTTPDAHPSVFAASRTAARARLHDLLGDLVADQVADEISDASLTAGLELVAANRIADPNSEGFGDPVHWSVYNAMHQRALRAEHALEAAGLQVPVAPVDRDGGDR
ncbi:hypothetical protein AB0J01_41305 [Streptomyces sp. NPDC050204]|uniref:hypothetical protein n=1 Tax=Streptomyces sp. NPDC050204 TaxID=3155514 RepID=UPI0034472AC0